jgi:16S rRNA U1498 N3-methylase RsmE
VAVGPEGGFAPDELDLGLPQVGFGPGVLRAETAAVAAGVILGALRAGTVSSSRPPGAPACGDHAE